MPVLLINTHATPPVALTIAGSDSSAGAGVQADLKTFAAHGVYGVNALTSVVAEAPGTVSSSLSLDSTLLEEQLKRVSATFSVSVVKTGMLATAGNVEVVADFIRNHPSLAPVVDPILHASAGLELLSADGLLSLRSQLLPLARIVTPNIPEAETLLGKSFPAADAALRIFETFGCNVLVKGGHGLGEAEEIIDHACIDGELIEFPHSRLAVPDLHGTGCTLSAAIAAQLALGKSLPEAVPLAIDYLIRTMTSHFHWPDPVATEALNHFPDGVESGDS